MPPYGYRPAALTAAQYNFLWGFWQRLKMDYCTKQGYFVDHPFYLACEANRKYCMEMNMRVMGFKPEKS